MSLLDSFFNLISPVFKLIESLEDRNFLVIGLVVGCLIIIAAIVYFMFLVAVKIVS